MSVEWRDWCRLCANSEGSGINIFSTAEIVWPDRIIKYLSISVNNEDDLPKQVCQSCCQRLTMFDRYAEQCVKVQEMYRSMSQRDNEAAVKVGSIRHEFLQESDTKSQDASSDDTKKVIELLAIEADPFIPSDGSSSALRKHHSKPTRKKRTTRKKSPVKPRKVPKTIISKIKIEDPERRSSRLQGIARMQMDYGIIDNDSEVKSESDNFIEIEKSVPKKRGRPPKRLVGAAKRKAKKPRVMKPKKMPSDEEFDDLGVEIKSETDTGTGPPQTQSIFRWECHICGETARNWNSLSLHTRREHQVPAQVLCLCAKVLSSRASIIKHRLKHTDGYKYKCEKCDKSFHRRGCYELHVLSHVPKEEQPFVCCKCARRFHCEALLRQHEKVHLPREERLIYPCTTCQKKFSSKSAVSAHIKSIHFGERPFVCDQCGHSFTSKGILQEHLTIHSDETPFKCQHCNKSFKTKYRLKIHLDIHRETPYQCPMCPLQLSTRRTLRMHLVVHKDTKAFQCSTCGKAFRRAKDLKNHHNLHTGRRPYTCTFCPRTFANGSNCRSHKRRMHPEELRIYEAQLAAAENAANNPGSTNQVLVPLPNTTPTPQPQDSLADPLKTSPLSHSHSLSHSPETSQPLSSPIGNQTMAPNTQDFQSQVIFDTTASMKNLIGSHVSRAPTNSTVTNTTMANTSNFQTHNGDILASRNLSMNAGSHTHNNLMSNLPVHRNAQAAGSRNGNFGGGGAETNSDCSVNNRSSMVNSRRMHTSSEGLLTSHIPNLTPLNLNISELHSNRHQMGSNIGMADSDRRLENFHSQRTQIPSLNQGHIPNLTSNLHQLRQHQNFGLTRGINDRITNLNRPERDMSTLNRSGNDRDLGNSNLNQMHHNSEHPNLLQGYTTSLNHLYQHPNSVAAAMAHSGTVGVPAFPGNPYVHHSMGSSLTNYQRGNGNM